VEPTSKPGPGLQPATTGVAVGADVTCYVLMPFSEPFDPVYEAIETATSACQLKCHRADMRRDIGSLMESMMTDIILSDVIIADISGLNPNVLYELGIAHALSKPTILLSQDLAGGARLPFDISQVLTVKYDPNDNDWTSELQRVLRRFLCSRESHSNPVEAVLRAKGIRLANHFPHAFLWGYEHTYRESWDAHEAWIVSHQLFWERLDSWFFEQILKARILTGQRRELVLMPDTPENQNRKRDFLKSYKRIEKYLRIHLLKDHRPFCFMPTEICIYDPGTPEVRTILLEPMSHEGSDADNDARIAKALASKSTRDLQFFNLKESTFDVLLSRSAGDRMSNAFRTIWNETAKPAWRI
jgi:nucleoside 2-deoxyribosyltransferase